MRLGVLDVGSNTVHLQIMDAHHGSAPVAHQSFKEEIKLAEYILDNGEISQEGIDSLISTLERLKKESEGFALDETLAFATSAIREATNSDYILNLVQQSEGFDLQVLSGENEASFTFLAVRRWMGWGAGEILMLDIGGGSLEIAIGEQENPSFCTSLPLGAGRLTRQFLSGDPFTSKSLSALEEHIHLSLSKANFPDLKNKNFTAIATSKTFRTLRRIQEDFLPEYGSSLTLEGLNKILPKLQNMTVAQRKQLPGVSQGRATQIVAGAMVARAAMKALDIKSIKQCPWALREGIVLQRLDWLMN